ncbi:MAG TPA: phosphate ABC transporter permease subunit PstC [Methanomassiliicoccales archaeon]|nr:phosphate ABC transporter permease subunit PstC [Methanomassiliicoccales archaeon]
MNGGRLGWIKSRASRESFINFILSFREMEQWIKFALFCAAAVSMVTLALVLIFLLYSSLPAFVEIGPLKMLTGTVWNPTSPNNPQYGMLPLIWGTFIVSLMASIIAIPIGMGCTLYIHEIAHPRIRGFLKPIIEILAGIPSVIYGFFALVILADWIDLLFDSTTRLNALNGSIMLAVMMIPIMVSLSEDALNSVPREIKEASYALGATRWETLKGVMIPAALSGIIAAIVLSLGRAIGETMTVLMATGNTAVITLDPLHSVETMTAVIVIEMGEVSQFAIHYNVLFAVGVVLFAITFIVNSIADWVNAKFVEVYR